MFMLSRVIRRNREKSVSKQIVKQAVGCVTEALECRRLLSAGGQIYVGNLEDTMGEYSTSGTTINASLVSDLDGPYGVTISGGDIFVANYFAGKVAEYTTSGATVTTSLIAGLNSPYNIGVSGDDLFVTTNAMSGKVGEYTTSGVTVNASLISGFDAGAIAVSGDDLFVGNYTNNTIEEYTTSGTLVNADLISGLDTPNSIAISGDDLFVANGGNGKIGEYTTSGTVVNASLVSGLDQPTGVAVAGSDVFVVNASSNTIGEYTTSGATVNASLVSGVTDAWSIAVNGTPNTGISGTVYNDRNGDGVQGRRDNGMGGVTVILQPMKDGKAHGHAIRTTTDSSGAYSFNNLNPGETYQVSIIPPRGYTITQPGSGTYTDNLLTGQDILSDNFGEHLGAV